MNTQILDKIEKGQLKRVPDIKPGDTVRVHQKITEGKKERVQVFEGVVLKISGGGLRKSFIVRKVSFGIGVERNFKIHSPNIVKIEVKKRAKVRRANLSYLRKLTGKSARLRDKQFDSLVVNIQDEQELETVAEDKVFKEDVKDAEVTELDSMEVGDVEAEVSLEEVEKAEEKQAAEAAGDNDLDDSQAEEVAEVEGGIEEAEKDLEKGKDGEDKSEKVEEGVEPEKDAE